MLVRSYRQRPAKKDGPDVELRDRLPHPNAEERASRREVQTAAADLAMKDHDERERHKRENMQRLRAERMARSDPATKEP